MVTYAQEDSSSRHAIMTILRLIRKWTVKFTLASQETIKSIQIPNAESSTKPKSPHPEASDKGLPTRFTDPTLYPSQLHSPFETLIPGIEVGSPHLHYALQDAKAMFERIAQGHKIDNMMKTLGDIIRHSITVPKDRKQKKPYYGRDEASDTRHPDDSHPEMDQCCPSVDCKHDLPESANLFFMYISSIGRYLDTAMTRPGWAMSESGRTSLEALYEATRELLRVSGEAVADTDDIVNKVTEKTRNQARQQLEEDSKTISAEKKDQVAHQCIMDIAKFLEQASDYVDALGRDRTMTKLVHALEKLRKDSLELFGTGKEEAGERVDRYRAKNRHHAGDRGTGKLSSYIQWLGWVLPRLLHLLPLGALPVPRIEIQTDDIECAIDARWIRGLAHGQSEIAVQEPRIQQYNEGIGGKLVPDEVLVKQWTEVKVSLSEGLGAAAVGVDDAQYRMGLTGRPNSENVPSVKATSRMKVCMDGIKACVRGLDYYFKCVPPQVSWHNCSLI